MKFDKLVKVLIEENEASMNVLFVEDMPLRHTLIKAYMQKYLPQAKYQIVANRHDAALQIYHNFNNITHYSLDFNLEQGETSEALGHMMKKMGSDGSNVYIHSDDSEGQRLLTKILPRATVVSIPKNIAMMAGVMN